MPDQITKAELCELLKVQPATVMEWRRAGMPFVNQKGKITYDQTAVRDWLIDTGRAKPPETILTTRGELAQELGVSRETIDTWSLKPGWPGRSGSRGQRDGYFPLERIKEWVGRNIRQPDDELRDAILLERLTSLRMANWDSARRLIDREAVTDWVETKSTLARKRLSTLAPALMELLPDEVDNRVRETLEADLQRAIEQAVLILSQDFETEEQDD